MKETITFEYERMRQQDVVRHIEECEGQHVQQAIYSTFMGALTQICFTEQKIRGSIYWDGNRSWSAADTQNNGAYAGDKKVGQE